MLFDEIGHDAAVEVQRLERAFLVRTHEPAVAGHIGGQDGGKPTLDLIDDHGVFPTGIASILARSRLPGDGRPKSKKKTRLA